MAATAVAATRRAPRHRARKLEIGNRRLIEPEIVQHVVQVRRHRYLVRRRIEDAQMIRAHGAQLLGHVVAYLPVHKTSGH